MKFRNIAISGDIGTGKSTLARMLTEELGWELVSTGSFFRNWYKENEKDVTDVDEIPEELDRKIDMDYQKKMKEGEEMVFESRLAGWLAKDFESVLKVLCVTDFDEAMRRVAKREGLEETVATDQSKKRSHDLVEKFERLYKAGDFLDPKYFDLVIDTTDKTPDEVLELVLKQISE